MLQGSVATQLRLNARTFPDRPAIIVLGSESTTITFADAWRRVVGLSRTLDEVPESRGIRPVALLLPNGIDAALSYVACQWAGCTAVPLNSRLAPAEMSYLLADSQAGRLLTAPPYLELARDLGVEVVDVTAVAEYDDDCDAEDRPVDGSRPLIVGYTSGTTGLPKGGLYSGDSLYIQYIRWGWQFGLTPEQTLLTPGPQFHNSYGGLSLLALMTGATNRVMPAFDPALAYEELAGPSSFAFLVPSMLSAVLDQWRDRGSPMEAATFVLSSGAPISEVLLSQALEALPNATLAEAYGWSEGGWVTFEVKRTSELVPTCVGWPMVGVDIQLIDADGRPADPGQPGEIVAKNLTPFLGYLGNDEATAAADWHGYHRSGDIGRWLKDGRLCVFDRKKDMIITGGENVYSAEVERVIATCPGVAEVAVVGLPSDRWGEEVTAVVVASSGDLTARALQDHCREYLAGYKVPKRVEVVDALPHNAMGKVLKYVLRSQFEEADQ